jgi:hypothetical protein
MNSTAILAHEHLRLTLDVMNFYADVWRPKVYRARVSSTRTRTIRKLTIARETAEYLRNRITACRHRREFSRQLLASKNLLGPLPAHSEDGTRVS